MEQLDQALQRMYSENVQESSQAIQTCGEISIYENGTLSETAIEKIAELLFRAFPKLPNPTFALLKDRFKALGHSDQKALDAVYSVIDTYEGWDKLPNIANFIQYDKKIKIYTYKEVCEMGFVGMKAVDIGMDSPRWAKEEDAEKYKLKTWDTK